MSFFGNGQQLMTFNDLSVQNQAINTTIARKAAGNNQFAQFFGNPLEITKAAKEWKKGHIFSVSFDVNISADKMFYGSFKGTNLWNTFIFADAKSGMHHLEFNGINLAQDLPSDATILFTIDNFNGEIEISNFMLVDNATAVPYKPALEEFAYQKDLSALSARISALESKIGGGATQG